MIKHMKADLYLKSIYEMNPVDLKAKGIKGLVFDIDNTLEPYHTAKMSPKVKAFLDSLEKEGFRIAILSNAKMERAMEFCEDTDVNWIGKAGKPLARGYRQLTAILELEPQEMACIGDQLYTDILGGNLFGCYTIYVDPIEKQEPPFVAFKRYLEKPFMKGIQ